MLRFFERFGSCDIIINQPIVEYDIRILDGLLNREYISFTIEFRRVYNVNTEIIKLLHTNLLKNKKIKLVTNKYKLNRYFHQLGFNAIFKSLINEEVVDIDNIDIVLIGGSADSSPKIKDIVKNTELDNLTLILVQHVEPDKKGIFDEILQSTTRHRVSYAKDGQKIQKGRVYIAPNDKHLKVNNGFFVLSDEEIYNFSRPSVSISYESFSSFYKERLLVIQECGYAQDGVDKLELLKSNSSKLIIQNKDDCEARPMITNALALHVEDYIFNVENIILFIDLINKNEDSLFDFLLDMIFKKYGHDFKEYHRDLIKRRLAIFMLMHNIKTLKDAVGIILFNKVAFKSFFLEVSINVTEFFRHPILIKNSIDIVVKSYKNIKHLKIWSAGCSSGEEVYSTLILLKNLNMYEKSTIYATDFNEVILEEAKNGIFSKEVYTLAKENFAKLELDDDLDNYFEIYDNFVIANENIRKKILFFQHNLVTDGSFNEFDIIICKNVVIYFNEKLQERVFKLFYDSLKFGGFLILGKSEIINQKYSSKFQECSSGYKIFKKVA